jgi:hypothetical protein
VRAARSLLLILLAAAAPARGEEVEIDARLLLHARLTAWANLPRADVFFDPATLRFVAANVGQRKSPADIGDYLRPAGADIFASGLLAVLLDGRRGSLRWQVLADSGEVRSVARPPVVLVCASDAPGSTGLILLPGGPCTFGGPPPLRLVFAVPASGPGTSVAAANGLPLGEEARATWFLREAWAGVSLGRNDFAFLRAGRHRFTVAEGLIHDDYGLGLEARLDLGAVGPPWDLGAVLLWPTRNWPGAEQRRSPMLVLRADWMLSLFEHLGAFAAFYRDRTGSVADLFSGAAVETSAVRLAGLAPGSAAYGREAVLLADTLSGGLGGSADLAWLGLSGRLTVDRIHRFAFTAALATGSIRMAAPAAAGEIEARVRGFAVSASWEVRPHRDLLAGGRFVFLSGDLPPPERARLGLPARYGGFLGVSPWITATNLFFAGGLSETFAARQATAPGVNGRGVLGPVLRLAYEPSTAFRAEARGAWLAAEEVGPLGGRIYGPEADLGLRWAPLPWLALSAEADWLFPGDFFGGGPPMRKLVAGLDIASP